MIKKLLSITHVKACLATVCLTVLASHSFAQFTSGNIVVLQAGDGSSALANTGNAVILKEFTPTGTPAYSLAVPSNSLVIAGNSGTEGLITRSANGQKLILAGYTSTLATSVVAANGTTVPRTVASVNAAGVFSTAATSTTFFSGQNIRGVTSDGAGNYWATGSAQGINYFGTTTTPTLITSSLTNLRAINIQGGDLAFSTGAGTVRGIYVVNGIGTGTTTAPGSTVALVVPTGTASSPYQFAIAPNLSYGYVADDNTLVNGGGIQKWVFTGTWNLQYTLPTVSTGTATASGARGLVVDFSGANPIIYATTAEGSSNRLISIVDGGSIASSTITTLATASTANTAFRGVAFSPIATASCNTPTIAPITSNAPICAGQDLNLQTTVTGDAPLTYSWAGAGSFSSNSVTSPTVTGATSSNYTLTASNACGTVTSVYTATVNANPVINVNNASICSGGSATLTATGATSYAWSPATNLSATTGSVVVANPTSTSIYVITGTTGACTATANSTVTVVSSPTLAVTSATICNGTSVTLAASGVSTYTWVSPASNNATVSVNPSANTNYTVTGQAAGCAGTFSAVSSVSVIASPVLVVSPTSPTICAGTTVTLSVTGVTSQTWTPGASLTTASISVSPTTQTTYTVTGKDVNGCSNTNSVTVHVNPLPTITTNSASICVGKTATLTASGTAATYSWNPTGVTTNTVLVGAGTAGLFTFTVTGTSALGCSKTITTNVLGIANPTVNITATPSIICNGQSVTLTANGATTYTWTNGITNGVAFTPTSTATYSVTGTTASCTGTAVSTVSVSPCTGIQENVNAVTFAVYPNPNNGTFTIQSSVYPASIAMYDVTGRQVVKKEITEVETSLNVAHLNNGVYYLTLTSEGKSSNHKIIISK